MEDRKRPRADADGDASRPKIVVTGAAGRIGGGIARCLRQAGHRVVGVDVVALPANQEVCDVSVQCDLVAACEPGKARDALQSAVAACE